MLVVTVKPRFKPLMLATLVTLVHVTSAILPATSADAKMIVPGTSTTTSSSSSTATTTTTHTWTHTTYWSPYHSSWPLFLSKLGHRPLRLGPMEDNHVPATDRLFPAAQSPSPTSKRYSVFKPEHRLFPAPGRGEESVHHRYVSYVSSKGTSRPFASLLRTKRSSTTADGQLAISSTSVLFPDNVPQQETLKLAPGQRNSDNVNDTKVPTKTEGKLVMEGLSLIGSLLRPGGGGGGASRPSIFSSLGNGLSPLLGQSSSSGHQPFPLLASASGLTLPFLGSPLSTSSTTGNFMQQQHYSPYQQLGANRPLTDLQHSYLFPAASALYPSTSYPPFLPPYGNLQGQQQQQQQKPQDSSLFFSGIPPSPYQALGVDNLLVPLVGMIGLNLLRPDIIKSRREGVMSDLDGIDVFRNLDVGDECLKRLACEAGVTVTDADDAPAIQKALERALAARRLVPNRHLGLKHQDEADRLQCGRHSCSSIDAIAEVNDDDDDLETKISSAFRFVHDA